MSISHRVMAKVYLDESRGWLQDHVDFEPTEVSGQYLDDLMKSKNTKENHFATYVTRTYRDAKEHGVRVNCHSGQANHT